MSFASPSKEVMARSAELLRKRLLPSILNQEISHAKSKKIRNGNYGIADGKIDRVLKLTTHVKSRLGRLQAEFTKLEGKVDILDLEKTHNRHHLIQRFSAPTSFSTSTPTPNDWQISSVFLSPIASPDHHEQITQIDHMRKAKLNEICIKRLQDKLKKESLNLQQLFEDNFAILKFRRAESCLMSMIKVQRRLKCMVESLCLLRDRLHASPEISILSC